VGWESDGEGETDSAAAANADKNAIHALSPDEFARYVAARREAQQAELEEKYDQALTACQVILKLVSSNQWRLTYVALLRKLGRNDDALAELKSMAENCKMTRAQRISSRFTYMAILRETNRWAEALNIYTDWTRRRPGPPPPPLVVLPSLSFDRF
jgi:tetratricopeptide (TPR) repeat protein